MESSAPFSELSKHLSFTDVLDNVDVGVLVLNAKGDFLFMNTVMVNWRNIPRQEYLKMNVHDFNGVLDVCVFDLVCQQRRRVSRLQYYRDYQKIDSTTRMRLVTGSPIFDPYGNLAYVVVLLQDVEDFDSRCRQLLGKNQILKEGDNAGRVERTMSITANSPEMRQVLSAADSIAPLDSTVLLYGESGTGKEVLANYIHNHSARKGKPMIIVNCAAFPENLIEAELFGYEKGSFTGANREGKMGLVEAAAGGTLFLDEINSLPLGVQGKVLRVLEEKSVQRIGSTKTKKVDFRLISATNQNLQGLVQAGTFREDLYYRLNVIPLTIPPLRSRREDIIPLCLDFLYYFCQKYNLHKTFSDEVLEELQRYRWPGNVREVRNFVERMVVMTPNATSVISSIPRGLLEPSAGESPISPPPGETRSIRPGALTREHLVQALEHCGGNRAATAEYLGISRRQLQYKIKEFQLSSRCRYKDKPGV